MKQCLSLHDNEICSVGEIRPVVAKRRQSLRGDAQLLTKTLLNISYQMIPTWVKQIQAAMKGSESGSETEFLEDIPPLRRDAPDNPKLVRQNALLPGAVLASIYIYPQSDVIPHVSDENSKIESPNQSDSNVAISVKQENTTAKGIPCSSNSHPGTTPSAVQTHVVHDDECFEMGEEWTERKVTAKSGKTSVSSISSPGTNQSPSDVAITVAQKKATSKGNSSDNGISSRRTNQSPSNVAITVAEKKSSPSAVTHVYGMLVQDDRCVKIGEERIEAAKILLLPHQRGNEKKQYT